MNYGIENLAIRLRTARERKGLGQRALSERSGIPQPQISRIEKGLVDLRLSSFLAISHSLDYEVVLVPRKALPATQSIINSTENTQFINPRVRHELDQLTRSIQSALKHLQEPVPNNPLRPLYELWSFIQIIDLESIKNIRKSWKTAEKTGSVEALQQVEKQLSTLRNKLAHPQEIERYVEPRPMYSLDDHD